jgi:hypothetical protein
VPAAVAGPVTVMVPVAATPPALSSRMPTQVSVSRLLANQALAWRWSMEPRPASVATWSALVTLAMVLAVPVPPVRFWPMMSAR